MTPVCHPTKRPHIGTWILSFFCNVSWDRPVVLSLGINQSVTSASYGAQSMRYSCTFRPIAVVQPALFQSPLQLSDSDPVSISLRATLPLHVDRIAFVKTSGQTRARSSCRLSTWPNCNVLHFYPLEEVVGCSPKKSHVRASRSGYCSIIFAS